MLNMDYIYRRRKSRNLYKMSRRDFEPDWNGGVNNPDDDGNVPLHWAAIDDSEEYLLYVLEQPNVKVNHRNRNGETALLLSIKLARADSFIMPLIEAGCDVTLTDIIDQTCLHMAIVNGMINVASELIKRGADINRQDNDKCTPLHLAVNNRDLESVCMLLYYNADVTICCKSNNTPLMLALSTNHLEISKTLFDYYCDFSCVNINDMKALNFALFYKSDVAFQIVEAGDDINYLADNSSINVPLASACMYESAQLFKLMWPKFDWRAYRPHQSSFLLMYLRFCNFPVEEWLECLYLILESPAVHDLIEYYRDEMHSCRDAPDIFLFYQLLHNIKYRKVALADRMSIIWTFLHCGAEVALSDINIAYKFYGFNEEFEALLSCFDSDERVNFNKMFNNFNFPMPTCILGFDDYSTETILMLLENQIRFYRSQVLFSGLEPINCSDLVYLLGYFALSYQDKQRLLGLLQVYSIDHSEIAVRLLTSPEVPSLIELSRNKVRAFIRKTHKITYPYQFHDAIKGLNIPSSIKDVVRFKMPVYF